MKQNNILNLIMGIILFIIGIALLANPVGGMEVIVLILGIIMIAYGVITIISNYSKRTENTGVFGAYTIPVIVAILGILLIVFRGPTAGIVLPLIIGIWMIVNGVISLTTAPNSSLASKILSIIMIILGVIVLICMAAGANFLGTLLGIFLIIFGIITVVQWFSGKRQA